MSDALRISVADDEPDMLSYYQRMLTHLGHKVVSCSATGRALVSACREQRPDLVITDLRMPELDGLSAVEQIEAEFPVPVILVSAYHSPELVERANAVPVQAFLVKPINLSVLSPAIDRAQRQIQSLREARATVI